MGSSSAAACGEWSSSTPIVIRSGRTNGIRVNAAVLPPSVSQATPQPHARAFAMPARAGAAAASTVSPEISTKTRTRVSASATTSARSGGASRASSRGSALISSDTDGCTWAVSTSR
jgi:hypothetical protein